MSSPGAPPYHSSHSLRLRPLEDRGTDAAPFPSHAAGNWTLLRHEPPRT